MRDILASFRPKPNTSSCDASPTGDIGVTHCSFAQLNLKRSRFASKPVVAARLLRANREHRGGYFAPPKADIRKVK